jgi:putative oxidoreductase
MLSFLRIVVGLLYMEHGLAKILDFPHQPNHAPYVLSTLNPGLQGLLELVGGLLLALGLFTRTVAFILAGNMAVAYFMVHAREVSSRYSTVGSWQSSTVSCFSISGLPAAAHLASIGCARRRRLCRRGVSEATLRKTAGRLVQPRASIERPPLPRDRAI